MINTVQFHLFSPPTIVQLNLKRKGVGHRYSIDTQYIVNVLTAETDLVCCDYRHLSGSAKELGRRPERHQEEGDVPPEGRSYVRPIFTCTNKNIINRQQPQTTLMMR